MARARTNTKDFCRHCDKRVVFVSHKNLEGQGWGHSDLWVHVSSADDFVDAEQRYCAREDDSARRVPGEPRNYCFESLQAGGVCGRPVQVPEVYACGIHAKDALAIKAARERNAADRELRDYIEMETEALLLRVQEMGLKSARNRYGGTIEVKATELAEWLQRLQDGGEDGESLPGQDE